MRAEITQERQYLHNPAPAMTLAVDITPPPTAAAVEAAIKAVVKHHPLLGCKAVQSTGGAAYFITTPEPGYTVYAAELEDEDDWLAVANDAQRDPFDMEGGELARFFILEGMGRLQLVICLHRIVGDASCLLSIARGVVAELNRPGALGDPLNYHAPAPLEGVKVPMMNRTMAKMMNKRWAQMGRDMRREDYLLLCDSYWERESGQQSYVFSKETTKKLADICVSRHISFGALVSAALVMAQPESDEGGYALTARPSGREEDMGDYERTATFRFELNNETPLADCAGQIGAAIVDKIKGADERLPTLAFMELLTPTLIDGAYYSAFGGYGDLMAAQARDMFGINHARAFNVTDLGSSAYETEDGARWRMERVRLLPQLSSTAKLAVGMIESDGQLALAAQFFTGEGAADQRENFLDAMARLEELAAQ